MELCGDRTLQALNALVEAADHPKCEETSASLVGHGSCSLPFVSLPWDPEKRPRFQHEQALLDHGWRTMHLSALNFELKSKDNG